MDELTNYDMQQRVIKVLLDAGNKIPVGDGRIDEQRASSINAQRLGCQVANMTTFFMPPILKGQAGLLRWAMQATGCHDEKLKVLIEALECHDARLESAT